MATSTETARQSSALAELGRSLTGTEASGLASRLDAGESLSRALRIVEQPSRPNIRELVTRAGLDSDLPLLSAVCRGIEGARSVMTRIDPLWTMPGLLAQTGPLTSSIPQLVASARTSIICSTYNFQRSSALWSALRDAAQRPELNLRVYVDREAAKGRPASSPSAVEIARHLRPGWVFQTKTVSRKSFRNHAKYIVVDHRFVLITSANFSHSAEFNNVELGVRIDQPNLADSIEREILGRQSELYERVSAL